MAERDVVGAGKRGGVVLASEGRGQPGHQLSEGGPTHRTATVKGRQLEHALTLHL